MDKQNLEISGDIYALTDQEKIVLSKFDDSSNLKADFNSLQADHTKIRASFDDQQINLSDQNHQKRTYLNIQYSRNDATPSSYQSNSEISPQTVVLSQTPSILQVKQQILESIQNNTNETYSKKKNGQKYFGLRSNFKEGNWQKQAKAKEDLIIKKNIALKSKEKEYKSVQQKVIQLQSSKGSWLFNNEIVQLLNLKAEQIKLINPISQNVPDFQHIWITILTIHWLQTYFQENCYQHQYILLKAIGFVDKIKKQYELPDPKIPLQKLFQNYSIKKD